MDYQGVEKMKTESQTPLMFALIPYQILERTERKSAENREMKKMNSYYLNSRGQESTFTNIYRLKNTSLKTELTK